VPSRPALPTPALLATYMATGKVRPTRPTSTGFKHCSVGGARTVSSRRLNGSSGCPPLQLQPSNDAVATGIETTSAADRITSMQLIGEWYTELRPLDEDEPDLVCLTWGEVHYWATEAGPASGGAMDPIMVTAASAAAVFANSLLEEAGSQTGKGLPAAAGKLVAWLRRSGDGDSETAAAVTMVQSKPEDSARVELLGQVLSARAETDAEFARQLRLLVDEVGGANIVQVAVGGAQIHGGVHGNARVNQVGRDQIQLRDSG
jgi:hypothetical protein